MPDDQQTFADGNIQPVAIQEEMERSFLDYAMSVIVSRALPDVRDGLKPVHRRIFYGMFDAGYRPDRQHVKSANIVGEVMGKYHPHGDQSIYDALARMAQDVSLRYPLIDGHGNFGDLDEPAGAMRYTEARLTPLAMQLIGEIRENTVDFEPTYDGRGEEPKVLPARFPNLLVNGSDGIAVGMATKIPPHNMCEVIDAAIHYIDHPDAGAEELMQFIKGPDFPMGGMVMGREGIRDAYTTGRGIIRMRGLAEVEEGRSGRPEIVVTQLPYQVGAKRFIEKVKELVVAGRLDDVTELDNFESRDGLRLVLTLKRTAVPQVVLNQLYKLTPLQETFGANMVALVDGVPRTLKLNEMIGHYLDHQFEVITRRTQHRLEEAQRRAHAVEGFLIALDNIDAVIALIRASADTDTARQGLMAQFAMSEIQAQLVLEMPLRRLTALEVQKLREEHADLLEKIADYRDILAKPERVRAIVKDELGEIKKDYPEPRRTVIRPDPGELDIEDLIADEELVVTLSAGGYVKAVVADSYRRQGRGGRGVQGANLRAEDIVDKVIATTAHSYLLFFTNFGRVYRLKGHEIPLMDRTARGQHIRNLLSLRAEERVQAMIDTRDYETHRFLLFATTHGQVKKTAFTEYDSSLQSGLIAINLHAGDEVVDVLPTSGSDRILLASKSGMAICFEETGARAMGRATAGVRGMRLRQGDEVIGAIVASSPGDLVLITGGGYGKRTKLLEFRPQARGGKGLIAIKTGGRGRGDVIGAKIVTEEDELFLVSGQGIAIRIPAGEISRQGRAATGVRVMRLDPGVNVSAVALIPKENGGEVPLV